MDTDYQFKRILLRNELKELKELIWNESEFMNHYPNFKKWLEHALEEILNGDRLAYGILKSVTIDGKPKLKLIGVTIIKITEPFSEMKSLFLDEDFRHKEEKYGNMLYINTEKQLLKRGITKIITDVPYTNQNTSSFLIKHGFQINGLIERYRTGDFNYILSKDLTPDYTEDPFDWCNLVKWVLKNVYNFNLSEREEVDEKTHLISFNLSPNKNSFSDYKPVTGVCLVYDGTINESNIDTICDSAQAKYATICSIVAKKFEGNIVDKYTKNRILCLDEDQIYNLSGCDKPTFVKNEIDGMIIEIRYTFFKKIKENEDSFVYFKGPGIGKYSEMNNKLLFFVDSCDQYPNGAIMGIGTVKECSYDIPKNQWDKYSTMNPIFSKKDFDSYAKYKHKVVAFVVEDFKRIIPIEYHDIKTLLRGEILIESIEHHYLDESLINRFLDRIEKENVTVGHEGIIDTKSIKKNSRF